MIKESVAGAKGGGEQRHLGMARRAKVVDLGMGKRLGADDVPIGQARAARHRLARQTHVVGARPVAGFAIDAGLPPRGMVRIGLQVVIIGQLADVAFIARCVEGERTLFPVQDLLGNIRKMPQGARRGVIPFLSAHIIRHG